MKIIYQNQETFFNSVMTEPNSGCWIWLKHIMPNGYGKSSLTIDKDVHRLAHRVSWILFKGEIPKNKFVLHKCDNRCCVNPDHLFIGTAKDNTQDMLSKNRMAFGIRHGNSKLLTEDILKIRELAQQGMTQQKIADLFKMSQSGISFIINKRNRRFE